MPAVRASKAFIPTLKEAPTDAQVVSHKLLVRAGFVRQLGAGLYDYLPLAKRSLNRIEQIIREEMEAIGAQEFYLPALHPADIWKESGRWEAMGDNMFRLKDRKGGDYCLGMTHEEIFTAIARLTISSKLFFTQFKPRLHSKNNSGSEIMPCLTTSAMPEINSASGSVFNNCGSANTNLGG